MIVVTNDEKKVSFMNRRAQGLFIGQVVATEPNKCGEENLQGYGYN